MSKLQLVSAALLAIYGSLVTLNNTNGQGSIEAVTVNVDGTNLDDGRIAGTVTRSGGDKRSFTLQAKKSGKVELRFLNKRATLSA